MARRIRLAWFSPVPPITTGIAAYTADLLPHLRERYDVDVFVHVLGAHETADSSEPAVVLGPGTYSAHDFIWKHQQQPYDLTVFQLGNSSHHDYEWPYLFRYPGLTVLHDAHVHHARAASLLRNRRADDYRREFAANHPDARPDSAELAVSGFDNHLYYAWPMTRLLVQQSKLVAVHSPALAATLRAATPGSQIATIRLGHGSRLSAEATRAASERARGRYGIASDAVVFGCYGGLSPDKRVPQILTAFARTLPYVPSAHLLLAGAIPRHYDLDGDIARRGLGGAVTVTGYLPNDEAFTEAIAACDVALNLRWPTAREISGPWLRCLAAAKPTIVMDLAQITHVPTLDPRTWQPNGAVDFAPVDLAIPAPIGDTAEGAAHGPRPPVAVAIDILDEDHSLGLAMRRLGTDRALRDSLGHAAQGYWQEAHGIDGMVHDYHHAIAAAIARPGPVVPLPAHLLDAAGGTLAGELDRFGLPSPFAAH